MEAQHRISTRRLVDSDDEQALLEQLIDEAKPPMPSDCAGLHYLLATSFRHPPLRGGSRFGTKRERSLWYGALDLETALAEVAYHRLLFLEGTRAPIEPIVVDLSAFQASLATPDAVNLIEEPFAPWAARISSPVTYEASQPLGAAMREDGVSLALYRSARCLGAGTNVALFSPGAFASQDPTVPETWLSVTTRQGVECSRRDYFERRSHSFPREQFEVDGRLPTPGL